MPKFRVKTAHLRLIYCITYNPIQMNNLALKWYDIDVSFLKENDEVMVNLTDMAKGFPKKNLAVIMNSKEMREYIQAIKRHYEARMTKIQNRILPDNQAVTNDETKIRNFILPDFQPVRVVHGGSEGEHGTWAIHPIAIRVAQKLNPDFAVWVDEMVLELLTKGKVELTSTNIEDMHLGHAVSVSEDDMYIADVAKLLKTTQGAPIGRNRLFRFLREGKYLGKKDAPYQKYMDKFTQTLVRCSDGKLRLVTKLKTSSIGWLMSQWNKRNLMLRCHIGDMDELF